ncbi:MAG: ParB N-terminal domain-containing protein [Treponema sp.]|nr:ParB N-terminal domain-containing protein [Treponema sp.]
MQVLISDIKIKKRIRKDLGNIASLAESLKKYGQISPILITKKNVLIAGERRLEAAKSLGWKTINAVIADAAGTLEKLELEIEENVQRQPFTAQEETEATNKLNRLRNPGFFRRIWNAIIGFFRRLFKLDN